MKQVLFSLSLVCCIHVSANAQVRSMANELKCLYEGFKLETPQLRACIERLDNHDIAESQANRSSGTNVTISGQPDDLFNDLLSTCTRLGFAKNDPQHAQCALQLYEGKQRAQADQERYQLDLNRFEAERARLSAAEQEQAKRQRRAKWEALQRFGMGMSQSQSPTIAGALADGNAAMLGEPLAHHNSGGFVAPVPARPRTVKIMTPDGRLVTCTTTRTTVHCM